MTNNYKFILIYKIIIFLLLSCNSNNKSNTLNNTTDTIQIAAPANNNTRSQLNNRTAKNDTSSIITDEHKANDELTILDAEIIFDADFNPSLFAELKNNMQTGVIALEIIIDLNDRDEKDCEKIIVKREISIPPNKTVKFKERIHYEVKSGCLKIERANIYLGDFILTNGKKTNKSDLMFERMAKDIKIN